MYVPYTYVYHCDLPYSRLVALVQSYMMWVKSVSGFCRYHLIHKRLYWQLRRTSACCLPTWTCRRLTEPTMPSLDPLASWLSDFKIFLVQMDSPVRYSCVLFYANPSDLSCEAVHDSKQKKICGRTRSIPYILALSANRHCQPSQYRFVGSWQIQKRVHACMPTSDANPFWRLPPQLQL